MASSKNKGKTMKSQKYWSIRIVDLVRTNMFDFDNSRLDMDCGPFKKHAPLQLNWSCWCTLVKAIRSIPSTPGVLTVVILLAHGTVYKGKLSKNSNEEEWHQLISSDKKHTCTTCKGRYILFENVVKIVEQMRTNVLLCNGACRSAWDEKDKEKVNELKAHKFDLSTPKIGIFYFTKQGFNAHGQAFFDPPRRSLLSALSLATLGGYGCTAQDIKRQLSMITSPQFTPHNMIVDKFDIDIHDKWLA